MKFAPWNREPFLCKKNICPQKSPVADNHLHRESANFTPKGMIPLVFEVIFLEEKSLGF